MPSYTSPYTGAQIDSAINKALNPDSVPTDGSASLITSDAVFDATAFQQIEKTESFNFAASDMGKLVNANSASAITATLLVDSTLDLPIMSVVLLKRSGAGTVAFVAGGGVTIVAPNGLSITAQHRYGIAIKLGANLWWVVCC